jgi:hypothetical protein
VLAFGDMAEAPLDGIAHAYKRDFLGFDRLRFPIRSSTGRGCR